MSVAAGAPLRLCQFNVLAPSARICCPLDVVPWRQRHNAICEMLLALLPDVVCLQEFDFAPTTAGFAKLYEEHLGKTYDFFTKKRTGRKHEGLAILVRKDIFLDVRVEALNLEPDFCDRVAQVARLRHAASGRDLLVVNTHLTVAHATNTHDIPYCRPLQMQQVIQEIQAAAPHEAVFLCADMNCDHLEVEPPNRRPGAPAYSAVQVNLPVQMAFQEGLTSALHQSCPDARPISHTSSYSQDGCVDYVLYSADEHRGVEQVGAFLHPVELPPDTPWSPETGWGSDPSHTLSDHRPLVVDFLVRPATHPDQEGKDAEPGQHRLQAKG